MTVTPSFGWGVLHLMVHVDRARLEVDPNCVKRSLDAIVALQADHHQVVCSAVLGHKADIMIMAVGPDLARLQQFQSDLLTGPLHLSDSFVSLTEHSPYTSVEADERARLIQEDGLSEEAEITTKLAIWAERMKQYQEHRIHPQLPDKKVLCFYPMLKRRDGADNWYALPFDDRKRLMGGHAKTGRRYAGRVTQLITGATGLDDWEWGVTLFADDPVIIKDIVHEMRFDEVSSRYAEFGTFVVGLCGQAADVFATVGLVVRPQ